MADLHDFAGMTFNEPPEGLGRAFVKFHDGYEPNEMMRLIVTRDAPYPRGKVVAFDQIETPANHRHGDAARRKRIRLGFQVAHRLREIGVEISQDDIAALMEDADLAGFRLGRS